MLDPEDGACEFFQGKVEGEFLQILTHESEKYQIVGQAEMIPCIISRMLWADRLQHRCCLHYIDTEAARCGLIRGYSPVRDNAFLNPFGSRRANAWSSHGLTGSLARQTLLTPPPGGGGPPQPTLGPQESCVQKSRDPCGHPGDLGCRVEGVC